MAALASVQKIGRKTTPLREGMNVVRQILHSPDNAGGMTPRQLYKAALEVPVPAAFVPPEPLQSKEVPHNKTGRLRQVPAPPPHPEHPVRSLTFLRNFILPQLRQNREITSKRLEPATTTQSASLVSKTWVWKAVDPRTVQRPKRPTPRIVYGHEVGAGEDWTHLNTRRQRSRLKAVRGYVKTLQQNAREKNQQEKAKKRQNKGPVTAKKVVL